jgi:hypothetical protein
MKDEDLVSIRAWAQSKIDAMDDPDWSRDKCQHIVALVDEMLGAQAAFALHQRPLQSPRTV